MQAWKQGNIIANSITYMALPDRAKDRPNVADGAVHMKEFTPILFHLNLKWCALRARAKIWPRIWIVFEHMHSARRAAALKIIYDAFAAACLAPAGIHCCASCLDRASRFGIDATRRRAAGAVALPVVRPVGVLGGPVRAIGSGAEHEQQPTAR
jgi:hypothetical protein